MELDRERSPPIAIQTSTQIASADDGRLVVTRALESAWR